MCLISYWYYINTPTSILRNNNFNLMLQMKNVYEFIICQSYTWKYKIMSHDVILLYFK